MWRRSWLSREVLFFSAFSIVACLYAAALWMEMPGSLALGGLTMALGLAGVVSSAQIYRVPSRPAWDSPFTLAQFILTAAVLGPLFAAAVGTGDSHWLAVTTAGNAGAALVVLALCFLRLPAADSVELQASGRLLTTTLSSHLIVRGALLMLGAIALPLYTVNPSVLWAALLLTLVGELLGRYLFFVSVVPKHMTAAYIGSEAA
jgi:DMSO reductase anchor subunit